MARQRTTTGASDEVMKRVNDGHPYGGVRSEPLKNADPNLEDSRPKPALRRRRPRPRAEDPYPEPREKNAPPRRERGTKPRSAR